MPGVANDGSQRHWKLLKAISATVMPSFISHNIPVTMCPVIRHMYTWLGQALWAYSGRRAGNGYHLPLCIREEELL